MFPCWFEREAISLLDFLYLFFSGGVSGQEGRYCRVSGDLMKIWDMFLGSG